MRNIVLLCGYCNILQHKWAGDRMALMNFYLLIKQALDQVELYTTAKHNCEVLAL